MKAILETIRRYLQHWDPIDVIQDLVDNGLAPDEYDSYAGPIYTMLAEGKTVAELSAHLQWIATEKIGISVDPIEVFSLAGSLHKYFHEHSGANKNPGNA